MEKNAEYLSEEAQILLISEESEESSTSEEIHQLRPRFKDASTIDDGSWPSVHSKKPQLKVYKSRWLVLGIFSLLAFMQVSPYKS